jgi:outer membrane receptor for monomeric catechols
MHLRRIECLTNVLVTILLTVTSAAGQGTSSGASVPLAHDSDLDELLVNGARTSDLPLLTQPLVDTPQTVTTISEEIMQLQSASDLRDVLRNDPSVSAHADEDNAQGTNVPQAGRLSR